MKTCIITGCNQPCEKGRRYCHRHGLDRRIELYHFKKACGLKYRTTYPRVCINCGRKYEADKPNRIFCSMKCQAENMRRFSFESDNNYIHVKGNQENNTLEHRKIAETLLKRKLKYNEVIHHLNGDSKDNRPENLIVLIRSNHSRLHKYLYRVGASLERLTNKDILPIWQDLIQPLTENLLEFSKVPYIHLSDPSTYNVELKEDESCEIKLSMSLEDIARQYIFDPKKN